MNRPTAALLPLALSFSLLAPARADELYYEGDEPSAAALKVPDASLAPTIAAEMKKRSVTALKGASGATDPQKLTRVEKIAVLYALPMKPGAGAELDCMVEDGGKYVPVEVQWSGGTIALKVGKLREKLYGKASSKEEIRKKYGVGAFVDEGAAWDNDSLFIVETALARLSPDELAGVAGIPFHRVPKDPRTKGGKNVAGLYIAEKMQVDLYDCALDADKRRFLGTVDEPFPLSVGTMIHECGHAFSRRLQREQRKKTLAVKAEYDELRQKLATEKKSYDADKATYEKTKDAALGKSLQDRAPALKQLIADIGEKKKQFDALAAEITAIEQNGSAVERALDAKLSFKKSPTMYGRSSIAESFADCLALSKLDRAALERAAPGVAAWFESPEYRALLR